VTDKKKYSLVAGRSLVRLSYDWSWTIWLSQLPNVYVVCIWPTTYCKWNLFSITTRNCNGRPIHPLHREVPG